MLLRIGILLLLAKSAALAKDITPPFALNQRASALSDLFERYGQGNSSELCANTSIANAMIYLREYRKPAIPLKVPYDQNGGGRTSRYDLIRYFVDLCGSSKSDGTYWSDTGLCVETYFIHSHLKNPNLKIISRGNTGNGGGYDLKADRQTRAITMQDIRNAIDQKYPVLTSIGWYVLGKDKKWKRAGGHMVVIYGYGESQDNTVMVTDPWERYPNANGRYSDPVKLVRLTDSQRQSMRGHDWSLSGAHYKNTDTFKGVLEVVTIPKPGTATW
ncbi:MAG: C39 family peptidase [Bdellovibrionales bacterium]|nr:C39 family peptidase [Bdellovibrionales bacterium]